MSLITPQFFKNSLLPGARVSRLLCAMVCLSFLTAVPALAEPVTINQVVQTLSSSQGAPDLKLNNLVIQDPIQKGGTPQSGPRADGPATQGGIKTDSIISGVTITGEGKTLGVETSEDGEVEGTICDCGEILVAGGAFPKWPFLFLAAVPLAFIHHCDDCDTPSSSPTPTPPATPTPTPTPPGVPEPASLLLFGTGLAAAGAGLRRRYGKKRMDQQLEAEEESDID